jgi:hypothetical protein
MLGILEIGASYQMEGIINLRGCLKSSKEVIKITKQPNNSEYHETKSRTPIMGVLNSITLKKR